MSLHIKKYELYYTFLLKWQTSLKQTEKFMKKKTDVQMHIHTHPTDT